jgi:hypothetical protein
MSFIQQFFTSRDNNANAETFVGQEGRLWWDPVTNQIYSSDGNTPGGIPLAGGGGNGTPGGSNSQVQFNNNGAFGGSANLTFVSATGALTAVSFVGNGAGLTSITGANVTGTVADATHAGVADSANSVAGGNVTGTVANATYATSAGSATTAGTVTTNAQPNITSVGTLTSLSVSGNVQGGNLRTEGVVSALGRIISSGEIYSATQITGGNINGANIVANGYLCATGNVNATGNISGGNVIGTTGVSVGGTGGDLTMTGGAITGVGNITANGIVAINAPGGITTTQGSFDIVNATATTVNIGGSATAVNIGAITGTATINNPTIVGSQTSLTLFNTTASNVSTFGAASNLIVGATSGTMTLRNPTIVGTQTTQSLFNTVATTVNFAGAATALNIGGTGNATFSANTLVRVANTSGLALSVAGNITGGNVLSNGQLSTAGNITGGNITVGGAMTAVGNIAASWVNGAYYTGTWGTDFVSTGNVTGTNLFTAGRVSATGNITGGNLTTTGAVYSNYNTDTANTGSFMATGGNTKGGTGYLDFLVAQNTSGGATNPYKWMRTTSDGQLQIINSAYTTNIFNLTDAGAFSVPGPISISGKQAVNGPAFSAYAAAILQNIPTDVQTKVLFQTEEFDTNNNYANSRFTPTVEGYYQLNAEVRLDGASGTGEMMIILYKNGSEYKRGWNQRGTQIAANFWAMTVSSLAYANGSTDYFEIYVQQGSGGTISVTAVNAPAITWFNGCMLRGA